MRALGCIVAAGGISWEGRNGHDLVRCLSPSAAGCCGHLAARRDDEPMSEIATRCGFESPSAFAKMFRAEMAKRPRDYREPRQGPALNQ